MTIKHLSKLLSLLLTFTLLLSLIACGGGGGGGEEDPVPVVKTAKLTIGIQRLDATQGTNVGSVDLDVTLPTAFVLQTTTTNIPTTMTAQVTGLNVQQGVNYTHPTLTLTLIKGDATAFSTGNLVSFTRTLQSGEALPTASSFQLNLIDVSEISANGDVTIQTQAYESTLTIEEI